MNTNANPAQTLTPADALEAVELLMILGIEAYQSGAWLNESNSTVQVTDSAIALWSSTLNRYKLLDLARTFAEEASLLELQIKAREVC
ncbi:hypothetical protein [Pseudomonas aeruginosa]|uniref:hypothetical protein n=1 Tax=Pseudomonas aeruginosa TaxID=287 RepID=UPI001CBA8D95|nr:hypothetical protein [Pseudomonas aeruginosa]